MVWQGHKWNKDRPLGGTGVLTQPNTSELPSLDAILDTQQYSMDLRRVRYPVAMPKSQTSALSNLTNPDRRLHLPTPKRDQMLTHLLLHPPNRQEI